jgi:raffinose/stachyose/melibiose transport system permease protein
MKILRRFLFIIGLLLIAAVMVVPFLWGFVLSFKDNYGIFNEPTAFPKTWEWMKYVDTFKTADLGTLFKNSVIVASITTVVALLINFLSSFPIARLHHRNERFGNFFFYIFLAGTAIPIFSVLWPYYQIALALKPLGMGVDSIFGLPWPYIAGSIPLGTLVFVGGLKAIPLEMEEAALIDGCSLLKIVFLIELPLVLPVFMTLMIFNFLGAWNEFTLASIFLNNNKKYTIPLAASQFREEYSMDYGAVMRAVIMVLIPQLIFYYIFQKRIIEGMTTQGLKG